MKRLLCVVLSLVLILVLISPAALAADMPLWEAQGYDSLEEYLAATGMTENEYYLYEASVRADDAEWEAYQKKQAMY